MSQNLQRLPEQHFTDADVDWYVAHPEVKPPPRHLRPRFHDAIAIARNRARHQADELARNPEFGRLQVTYAETMLAAQAGIQRERRKAELQTTEQKALEREARLRSQGDNDAAHDAHMEAHRARREYDTMVLEDFRTTGTDADPYKPIEELHRLTGKMKETAKQVSNPRFYQPQGWEHRNLAWEQAEAKKKTYR